MFYLFIERDFSDSEILNYFFSKEYINWVEALPIHGNLRYTGQFSEPNFTLAENCIDLYLMVPVILSSGYPFCKRVVLMKLSSLVSFDLE